jgi:septum formation protein
MDKAGAYGAQGIASLFVEGIDGDFFNVMGLPLCRLGKMLSELGVDLI